MNILDTIVAKKKEEIQIQKRQTSIADLKKSEYFNYATTSLKNSLAEGSGIIAEFKRKSPSKGIINQHSEVSEVTLGYENSGASGLSILTDESFFGGSKQDLLTTRRNIQIPILRKDFIIDPFQIYESKAIGADVILLIARILTPDQTKLFTTLAHELGMEVLLEIHGKKEIEAHYCNEIDMIGINNRNLNSFEVSIQNSIDLARFLPKEALKIAESGIESAAIIQQLKANGFSGFLIGEYFMKQENPSQSCLHLIEQLKLIPS